MEYDDFVVQILPGQGQGYEVRIDSPAGQGKSRFEVPPDLRWESLKVDARDLGSPGQTCGKSPVSAREIGDRLFQAVFTGDTRDLLLGSLRKSPDRGLRIRLRLDPEMGEVVALPWECLHFPESLGFLGLSRRILIVVSLDIPQPQPPPLRTLRLRVLAIASSPGGLPRLDLERECHHLEAAVGWRRWLDVSFLSVEAAGEDRDGTLLGGASGIRAPPGSSLAARQLRLHYPHRRFDKAACARRGGGRGPDVGGRLGNETRRPTLVVTEVRNLLQLTGISR